jgi:hypothetical protein
MLSKPVDMGIEKPNKTAQIIANFFDRLKILVWVISGCII